MLDTQGDYPLWLRWFLDAENTDAEALQAALRVVPTEFWPSVYQDISRGLAELSWTIGGGAGDALEMKRALLTQEDQRRKAS